MEVDSVNAISGAVRRPPGRPKTGSNRILFAQRVAPEVAEKLKGWLADAKTSAGALVAAVKADPAVCPHGDVNELEELRRELAKAKADNIKLLNDQEHHAAVVADWAKRLDRCVRASDDEKALRWMRLYDELKAKYEGAGEWDQTSR